MHGIASEFDPIHLVFVGDDADEGSLDLILLGQSLEGFGRVISACSTFVATGEIRKHVDSQATRVRFESASKGSLDIKAAVDFVSQSQMLSGAVGAMLSAVIAYVIEKIKANKSDEEMKHWYNLARDNAELNKAVTEKALDALSESLRTAVKAAVAPLGKSCESVSIKSGGETLVSLDASDREKIIATDPIQVGDVRQFRVYITELDLNNETAKGSFDDPAGPRVPFKISDPELQNANNVYAQALLLRCSIVVTGKPQIVDGEISKLVVLDGKLV